MEPAFSPTEKPVPIPKKRDQSKRRASYQPKITANGRPTKRTPEVEKALIAAIETGAPYRIACLAVGISDDAFTEWRRRDRVFADRVNKAAGQTALRLLKKIEKNADENFSAAAWLLERRFPESFSRPEIQLGVAMQINQTTNNVLTITAEQAENLGRRNAVLNKELDALAKAHEAKRKLENGVGRVSDAGALVREVEAESSLVHPGPITLPPVAQRTRSWWRQLSTGDAGAVVTSEAAHTSSGPLPWMPWVPSVLRR
jgi:hypothetical protein